MRAAFPRGDVFVDSSSPIKAEKDIKRFFKLIFGNSFITPTKDEFSMFHAFSAALRSADLARQVGAVITKPEGDIVSVGCNEVPKAGGGSYWEGDAPDSRDFQRGCDSSDEIRRQMVEELVSRLKIGGWLSREKTFNKRISKMAGQLLDPSEKGSLKGSKLMSVIEFGRSVHAEMSALMSAARTGARVQDSTLYCTTFPCHLCARHIVAAGVKRVVYVEPYPKSLAKRLYDDSITVDEEHCEAGKVQFEPFVGIAPRLYEFAFKMTSPRKSDETGEAIHWDFESAKTKLKRYIPAYVILEDGVLGSDLPTALEKANFSYSES